MIQNYMVEKIVSEYVSEFSSDALIWNPHNYKWKFRFNLFFLFASIYLVFNIDKYLPYDITQYSFVIKILLALIISLTLFLMYYLKRRIKKSVAKTLNFKDEKWNNHDLRFYQVKKMHELLSALYLNEEVKIDLILGELSTEIEKNSFGELFGVKPITASLIIVLGAFVSRIFALTIIQDDLIKYFLATSALLILFHLLFRLYLGKYGIITSLFLKKGTNYEEVRSLIISTKLVNHSHLKLKL